MIATVTHTNDPWCNCFECTSPDALLATSYDKSIENKQNHADTQILRAKVPIKLYASPSESAKVYRIISPNGIIGDFTGTGLFHKEPVGWKHTTYGWIKNDPSTWYEGTIDLSHISPEIKYESFKNIVSSTTPGSEAIFDTGENISGAINFLTGYWKQILIGIAIILIIALFLRIKG
jgi:hypothetical protein